jgi:serine/threonine protein kinase
MQRNDGMGELQRRFQHLEDGPRRAVNQPLHGFNHRDLRRQNSDRPYPQISVPGYSVVKSLKTGGMSEAILVVRDKRHGKVYIAKRVSGRGSSRTMAELNTLRRIRQGQNLNYMVDHFWNLGRTHLTFILEYCDGGTLEDMIQQHRRSGRRISEAFLWHAVLGIANAIAFLHWGIRDAANGGQPAHGWKTICHLDIKPQNVFLSNSDRRRSYPRIVLGDFGCATSRSDIYYGMAHPRVQEAGTPSWYPPECDARVVGSKNTCYGPASDTYCLAATIQALGRRIDVPDKSRLGTNWAVGSSYSQMLNVSVGQMSARNYNDRPDAAKIVRQVRRLNLRR